MADATKPQTPEQFKIEDHLAVTVFMHLGEAIKSKFIKSAVEEGNGL